MEQTALTGGAVILQVMMGVCLAACAGLRAFLPLFVLGVAGRLDLLTLTSAFDWLESTPALVLFGVAVLTELASDKFPFVDNFLDLIQGFVKPIAGTILAAAVLTELTILQSTVLGLVLGGSVAWGVHVGKAKARLLSSATTAGVGNPLLSFVEDVFAFAGSLASVLAPLIAAVGLIVLVLLIWLGVRRLRRRIASTTES